MYIKITDRCNMACPHCAVDCRPGKGEHMGMYVFQCALALATDYSETVSLGGGEPTMHPQFFDILRRSLWSAEYVWFATNGKKVRTMRRLIQIMDQEDYENDEYDPIIPNDNQLSVALSLDPYHEPINPVIEREWRRRASYQFEVRNTSEKGEIIKAGRAARNGVGIDTKRCFGPGINIRVNGDIHACACPDSLKIGHAVYGMDDNLYQQMIENEGYQSQECWSNHT